MWQTAARSERASICKGGYKVLALPAMDKSELTLQTTGVFVRGFHPRELHCEVVNDFRRLEELSSEWKRLWNSDPRAEIFQSPEWAMAWWRSFGHRYTLCSLVVFAGEEVVGIVPLVERKGVIHFLGTPEADYADIVCSEEWAREVLAVAFQTLLESISGWSECALEHLSKNSRVVRYYRELPEGLLASARCRATERYQIFLGDQDGAAFESVLGKHHTRRIRNKLQKAGQVRFRHLETPQEAETQLTDFFRQHVRRFAVTGRRSHFATSESRQFLRALVEEFGLGDKLRFGVLELNSRPLAWHFGFELNGKFLLYQSTFDLDASGYTPGELLLWNLLAYSRDHFIREFDFGIGDEFWKSRFSNCSRETFSIFIEPRGFAGRMRGLVRGAQAYVQLLLRRMKKTVKSRAAMRALRSLRRWKVAASARMKNGGKKGAL
jgi:CelD/BcsL family acetyltransferase involved in cellulose biosynthesis